MALGFHFDDVDEDMFRHWGIQATKTLDKEEKQKLMEWLDAQAYPGNSRTSGNFIRVDDMKERLPEFFNNLIKERLK